MKIKRDFNKHTLTIFCPVITVFFELRIKQRHIPRRPCSWRSAMSTLGFTDFWLVAVARFVYGDKPRR